jgi:putative DNA primase/helicase
MKFAEILGKFQQVSEMADGGYIALCTAHGDSRPSLRIWLGDDGKVRFICRAGCETGKVVESSGLRWKDMFNADGEGARAVPVARPKMIGAGPIAGLRMWLDSLPVGDGWYAENRFGITPEMAEALGLRYQAPAREYPDFISYSFNRYPRLVVPLEGFDGVARGAQGRDLSGECQGRWLSLTNPDALRWAPYGVLRASNGCRDTIVTEGPGDGLTAVSQGYNAVVIRGAALARDPDLMQELAQGLQGHRVWVAGDNDKAGQTFNTRLADGLRGHLDVFKLQIPEDLGPKSDLTDWRERDPMKFPAELAKATKGALKIGLDGKLVRDNKAKAKRLGALAAAFLDEGESK